jgi:hypothetical protein
MILIKFYSPFRIGPGPDQNRCGGHNAKIFEQFTSYSLLSFFCPHISMPYECNLTFWLYSHYAQDPILFIITSKIYTLVYLRFQLILCHLGFMPHIVWYYTFVSNCSIINDLINRIKILRPALHYIPIFPIILHCIYICKSNKPLCRFISYGIVKKEFVLVPDQLFGKMKEFKPWFDLSFRYVESLKAK